MAQIAPAATANQQLKQVFTNERGQMTFHAHTVLVQGGKLSARVFTLSHLFIDYSAHCALQDRFQLPIEGIRRTRERTTRGKVGNSTVI
jgi:hypothetical protein